MKEHPTHTGYFITEDGQVWSYWKTRGKDKGRGVDSYIDYTLPPRLKKPILRADGRYDLSIKGKRYKLHRLVAETYIGNPYNLPEVNHIDEDVSNNQVHNLEWCSRQYNAEYSLAKNFYILEVKTNKVFNVFNITQWCKKNNVDMSTLYKTKNINGPNKTVKGYKLLDTIPAH
jgi:hypothetical protein